MFPVLHISAKLPVYYISILRGPQRMPTLRQYKELPNLAISSIYEVSTTYKYNVET